MGAKEAAGAVESGAGLISSISNIGKAKKVEEEANQLANIQYSGIVNDASASRFGYRKGGRIKRNGRKGYKKGGEISGPGTAKSDSIKGKLPEGTFVVPAENADIASDIGQEYLGWTQNEEATLNAKGEKVAVSDGEVIFTPEEVAQLEGMGINLDTLAPNAEEGADIMKCGGRVGGHQRKAEGGEIVSPIAGDDWEYRKDPEGNIYTRKKGSEKWIKPTGKPLAEIQKKVFAEKETTKDPTALAPGFLEADQPFPGPGASNAPLELTTTDTPLGPPTEKQQRKEDYIENLVSGKGALSPDSPENAALIAASGDQEKPPGDPDKFTATDALPFIGAAQSVGGIAGIIAAGSVSPLTVSNDLNTLVSETQQEAQYGFEPEQKAANERRIQQNLHNALNAISSTGGGGPASSYNKTVNAMNQANKAGLEADVADANLRQEKKGIARHFKASRGAREDYLQEFEFQDVRNAQGGMAEVFSAGLDNITGAVQYKYFLEEKRKRDLLLGNTLP
ncbi:MAG: hypothetical protein JRJ37_06225 [Deltaproteobacteria bacterium]|nr:hypothetical protein [Deltaproteobacteria bacterium]